MENIIFNEVDEIKDSELVFAVIISRYKDAWVLCKHKERETWEIPGGHREDNETIIEAAKRELYEETGATEFTMDPVCIFTANNSSAMLFYANIKKLDDLPQSEIEKISLFTDLDIEWTYPKIQPIVQKHFEENFFDKYK